ncbi:HAD family hydrolase [Agarivorans sp. DSG3-1]|uniref:HAD family hydrolase n=1 Tax=Agarivorans sp. DSG3-1 TaxID=3342249 RepID=UPI00398E9B61
MQFDLSDIQLCIFDLDGTLVNSATDEIPFFFEKLSKRLDKSIAKNFTHYPHRTFASAINNVTPEHRRTELYDLIEKEMNNFARSRLWSPLKMGNELFKQVSKHNINWRVVTGNFKSASLTKASMAGLELPIEAVYATDVKSESKAKLIKYLMKESHCLPHQVLSIGDSSYDKATAKQLGLNFFQV